jgi:hypothetical protein
MNLPRLPPRKAHKGLLREDLLVLRHIFDLDHGQQSLAQDRLEILGLGQNLPNSGIKDLMVVGIDVENPDIAQLEKNGRYQIGLCILDTRDLQASIGDYTEPASLRTHQFCIGPPKYFNDTSRSFCFGEAKHLDSDDINTMIRNLVSNRDIVLVVHGGVRDLHFLQAAKVDLNPLFTLDTQKAAQHPLDLDHRCTLEEMLNLLGCPFGDRILHAAGNDANFTLRALLLIATVDSAASNHPLKPEQKALLSAFKRIAKGPVPLNGRQKELEVRQKIEENRARRRREKRVARRIADTTKQENEEAENLPHEKP